MKATGHFRPPVGLQPNDIEDAWSRLSLAQQQRDNSLQSEVHK